jgi:hypothetical protein
MEAKQFDEFMKLNLSTKEGATTFLKQLAKNGELDDQQLDKALMKMVAEV